MHAEPDRLLLAGIAAAVTGSSGAIDIDTPLPSTPTLERTLPVPAEVRTLGVPWESRTLAVAHEARTLPVPHEDRSLTVSYESRTLPCR